ncbi:hypothetical protein ACH4GK_17875 [Streptomyces rimosus]|uniref:hypothetical protein n=1 Tax=Streptomyces rimosus TaxID=1927 RepID=UPI0004CB4139|nr:hypothetical protein [Streptomyces rimosus]
MAAQDVQSLSAEDLAQAYYVAQARHARRTADRVQELWGELDRRNLTGSWQSLVGPAVVRAVAEGQVAAAAGADAYVDAVATVDGERSQRVGRTWGPAFAGQAADGRSLESLLYLPVISSKQALAAGVRDVEAMLVGLKQLLRMAASEVADVGRSATGASMVGQRLINGYVRVVNPPACARCIILAGKQYGWNAGFQRHPRCDCVHMPTRLVARGRHRPGAFDSRAYFRSLSRAEQDRIFTAAGATAIRDGASISSVVNARRGMTTIAGQAGRRPRATYAGTTRRSLYFQMERARAYRAGTADPRYPRRFRLQGPRLLPEQIYRVARSRDEAIELLRRYGYMGWSV